MNNKNSLPRDININGSPYEFNRLLIKFSKTVYGKTLRSNIRFSEFKPEDVSNEHWVELLGKDVSNLYHLYVSLAITKQFLLQSINPIKQWKKKIPQEAIFSIEEQKHLLFTSVTHDWAEAIIGDIPLTSKKASDEAKEMEILRELFREILGSGKKEQEIDALANTVQGILTNKTTKLGKAFNAIEKIGYLKTGMKSWYLSKHIDDEIRKKRLERLTIRVVTIHSPKLFDYAPVYPAVNSYLHYRSKPLTDIFNIIYQTDQLLYERWRNFINLA